MKKKILSFVVCIAVLLSIAVPVFAYSYGYNTWPSTKQTEVCNAYLNYYLGYEGTDYLSMDDFLECSKAFSTSTNPSWTSISSWVYYNFADSTEYATYKSNNPISIVARAIYAENTNAGTGTTRREAMEATADVIMNRAAANKSAFGGSTYEGVVSKSGAFSCTRDGNIGFTNPIYFSGSELDYWSYALFIANHMYSSTEPWGRGHVLDNNIYYCYDTDNGMPFYTSSYTKCTLSNIESGAEYYKYGSTYYDIIGNTVVRDSIAFFSWDDGIMY